jgi:hypothetical protein
MLKDIIAVHPLEQYQLHLQFEDGILIDGAMA